MKLKLSMPTYTWICYAIGFVFIISGMMKLVDGDFRGMFASMGLPFPEATLFLVAVVELGCGILIAGRLYIHLAVPPLLLIMFGALYFSKLPTLFNEGVLSFAFAARLDIVMLILLLLVWQHVRGKIVL
ncbi:DoxX family protein [Oceanobacillus jordanicus]|nr:DoxX family protein [Oceanobacillus jordanicus]